jgi:hypothetical protein
MSRHWLSLGLLLLLIPSSIPAANAPGDGWQPGQEASGDGWTYRIFSREVEGESFVRYRASGTIDAEPEVLVRSVRVIAADPERAPAGQTRRLLSTDGGAFVTWTVIDMPPLFSDRDIVTRGVSSADEQTGARRIDWTTTDDAKAPESPDVIRIRKAAGFWAFTPNGTTTDVSYETHLDLGGSLPGWLVQGMMAGMVGKNFEDVAREALGR